MASNHSPVLKLQYNIDQHWPDPEYRIEIFPNKDICLKTSKKTGDVSVFGFDESWKEWTTKKRDYTRQMVRRVCVWSIADRTIPASQFCLSDINQEMIACCLCLELLQQTGISYYIWTGLMSSMVPGTNCPVWRPRLSVYPHWFPVYVTQLNSVNLNVNSLHGGQSNVSWIHLPWPQDTRSDFTSPPLYTNTMTCRLFIWPKWLPRRSGYWVSDVQLFVSNGSERQSQVRTHTELWLKYFVSFCWNKKSI